MPLFLDHHKGAVPSEMQPMLSQKISAGQPDEFGAVAVNVFVSQEDTWCLSNAPTAEAVHKAHESVGVRLEEGDINEIKALA